MTRAYDAVLLDLDGTLVDAFDRVHPRTRAALERASATGATVMIATGRSELATLPVLDDLGPAIHPGPAIVYNGAGLYCPRQRRFLEERVLSDRTLERAVAYGRERDLLTVSMCAGIKYASRPVGEMQRLALKDMTGVSFVEPHELLHRRALRVTLFSDSHADSQSFAAQIEQHLDQPCYITHFPLNALPHHAESRLLVCDVHPPCRGKGEGVRYLSEQLGIPPARVVAIGDASNDVPMFQAAGLAVAMQDSMPEALAAAGRVIGPCGSDAIGALLEELFCLPRGPRAPVAAP